MSFQSKEIFLYARGRSSSLQFGGRARSGTAEYLTDPSGWTRLLRSVSWMVRPER